MLPLRTTRRITYTTPPSAADLAALEEIAGIDSQEKPDKATKAARARLAESLQPAAQIRATVATMSALQANRYQQNRRIVFEWIEAETGQKFSDATDTPEGIALLRLGLKWAIATAAVVKLEQREIGRLESGAGPDWQEIERPAEWSTPAGYLGSVPPDLADELDAAALAVNPGIYGAPVPPGLGDDVKKRGGISVE